MSNHINCSAVYRWDLPGNAHYDLGDYLTCMIPRIWNFLQVGFVATSIILVMYLIYKTTTNRENSTVLEEVQKQWPFVILLAITTIGGAGTFLNIILRFLGFEGIDFWLQPLNDFINIL